MTSGSIERFADVGNYASYCRCVGSAHVSNGKKKGDGNTKNGNRYLAWAFVKAANFAVRFCEPGKGKMGKEKKGTHTIFSGRPYGNSRVLPFRAFPTALQAGQVLRPTAIGRIKKTDLGPRSWKLCASPLIDPSRSSISRNLQQSPSMSDFDVAVHAHPGLQTRDTQICTRRN